MSSINSVGGNLPVQKVITPPVQKEATVETAKPTSTADRVELSGVSHLLASLKTGGDVRADKIAPVRAQIEAGTYEDDHKLDVASDRLLDDLKNG